jgi:integrase/recombinase XerD
MSDNFSILFYLNKQKTSGENYKIYCRIIVNRLKSEFYTGYSAKENEWDEQKRTSNLSEINEELSEISSKLYKIRRKLLDNQLPITAASIVDYYKGKKSHDTYLSVYIQIHIDSIVARGEHSRVTIGQYKATHKIIKEFLQKKFKKKDFLLTEINYNFLQVEKTDQLTTSGRCWLIR